MPYVNVFCSALFVTWNTIQKGGKERLRGCIGTLEPKRLPKALEDYALTRSDIWLCEKFGIYSVRGVLLRQQIREKAKASSSLSLGSSRPLNFN